MEVVAFTKRCSKWYCVEADGDTYVLFLVQLTDSTRPPLVAQVKMCNV